MKRGPLFKSLRPVCFNVATAKIDFVESSGTNVCTLMEETLSFEINSCIILVYSLNTLHTLFAGR